MNSLQQFVILLFLFQDLQQIPSGMLAQRLLRVVEFARNHVLGCWLCSQKGFICEVCNNPQVIYPFDTDTTYRVSGIFNSCLLACLIEFFTLIF